MRNPDNSHTAFIRVTRKTSDSAKTVPISLPLRTDLQPVIHPPLQDYYSIGVRALFPIGSNSLCSFIRHLDTPGKSWSSVLAVEFV